jgi:hypothetical protein
MPDLETRMPELLRRAASGVAPDPGLEGRVLRRARRRRARNAAAAGLTAVVLIVGIAAGARELTSAARLTPGDSGTPTPSPEVSPSPTGPTGPIAALPEPVHRTRDAILAAIRAGDFDALEALIDPDRFSYNFDDGSNPVPEWRKDPSVLEALALVLEMPSVTREGTPDVGTIYVWPSLTEADLDHLTDEEWRMLATLGITEEDVRAMRDFGAYTGPRTGIAQDGTWLFYTIGGD